MNRSSNINLLNNNKKYDFIIIGGGASGLGCALDASSRGYSVILLEKFDFCKGTSSRSTKLIHGGVRYLEKGQIGLVYEALKERDILKKNAPHLIKQVGFLIPVYNYFFKFYYFFGLKIYDFISGNLSFKKSKIVNKNSAIEFVPNVSKKNLKGGVVYYDGQFDDSRLGIDIAHTSEANNAILINYISVESLIKENGKIKGVVVTDTVSDNIHSIRGSNIINATGVFSKSVMDMDSNKFKSVIRPSQGVHLVVDKTFLKGKFGILVPKTSDGRVLFAVPWLDNVIIGTTDSVVDKPTFNPVATQIEIDFILENLKNYLEFYPKRSDIKSVFVGLRPLVASNPNSKSKDLSRKHKILVSESGLVSVIGGKWTTYRKMANKVIDIALKRTNLPFVKSDTGNIKIENGLRNIDFSKKSLSHDFFLTKEMIIHYVNNEMALNLDDIMSRRSRCVFLNTKESIKIAPKVVEIMSKELSKDESWIKEQLKTFYSLININKI
ncbi:glycerol-3-phosphate dehydrogenase/oxidase [Flavobacteriaceae bacterium]|nr:glycerol-3-phosphate dehydrogenase/oxidase [Flavobacteriaceae bacterium]MDB4240382.1 glycerol-3-phosphate dehydrogenase/oxidase [Flavobacteriaceae bacterium]MDB9902218.1 glycerol-3-phosphate dehydrogenase/oxidase [Flavobacteriaceae bacterium]MDC0958592.1 glycerol-3-phosphate dehydrogenase/oxidase [Flavobacteriaceae bacterium]